MQPVPPFWFQQRQAKMEPAGTNTFRLTAPNQGEAFIIIERADNGHWSAGLKTAADGPVVTTSGYSFSRNSSRLHPANRTMDRSVPGLRSRR